MKLFAWTPEDLRQMKSSGIDPEEASRQLELFRNPPSYIQLERPAQVGDGIRRLRPVDKKNALR